MLRSIQIDFELEIFFFLFTSWLSLKKLLTSEVMKMTFYYEIHEGLDDPIVIFSENPRSISSPAPHGERNECAAPPTADSSKKHNGSQPCNGHLY